LKKEHYEKEKYMDARYLKSLHTTIIDKHMRDKLDKKTGEQDHATKEE